MKGIDPRFAGTASKGDPRFDPSIVKKADGYSRTKAQKKRESHKNDPYSRDPNDAPLNRFGIV